MVLYVTRRHIMQTMLTSLVAGPSLFGDEVKMAAKGTEKIPVTGKAHLDLSPFDDLMIRFVAEHEVPGAALAVTRNSQLVYSRGFGYADMESKRPVKLESLFRIASVSKPFTAVGVLQLVQAGKFGLDDHLFELLPAKLWLPAKHDDRLRRITVRQLLQHTAGWDRDESFDPIGVPNKVAKFVGHRLPVGPEDVVRYTLSLPLDFDPGARHAYSNVGYLLLGRLIEKYSGQKYEAFIHERILQPIGVSRMQLGRARKKDLAKGEVHYYDSKHRTAEAVNGPHLGTNVPLVYGGENFEGYEAHGGWIASAVDLVRFASAFDQPGESKLLDANTIAVMWSRPDGAAGHQPDGSPKDAYYGCGWNVRPVGKQGKHNAWHTGLIAGTSSLLVRRFDGLNWAVLFNTDRDQHDKVLSGIIDPLIHQAADAVKHWPDREAT